MNERNLAVAAPRVIVPFISQSSASGRRLEYIHEWIYELTIINICTIARKDILLMYYKHITNMAATRTRGYLVYQAALICLFAVLLDRVQVCEFATPPIVDPNNSSVIIWGDLPPIPAASNISNEPSRPGTLAKMAEGFVNLVQPQGLPLGEFHFLLFVRTTKLC